MFLDRLHFSIQVLQMWFDMPPKVLMEVDHPVLGWRVVRSMLFQPRFVQSATPFMHQAAYLSVLRRAFHVRLTVQLD